LIGDIDGAARVRGIRQRRAISAATTNVAAKPVGAPNSG
jgi:hypothetical protein